MSETDKKNKTHTVSRSFIIREICERTGFHHTVVSYFFDTFQDILIEQLANHKKVSFFSFFTLKWLKNPKSKMIQMNFPTDRYYWSVSAGAQLKALSKVVSESLAGDLYRVDANNWRSLIKMTEDERLELAKFYREETGREQLPERQPGLREKYFPEGMKKKE